jgi:GntR family transcriptional regulator, transcriptional repressor for pyruvate dehydrogenase complex
MPPQNDNHAPTPQTVSQKIAVTLIRDIVGGRYPTDTKLPTERDLAAEFGVARHAVREALKRLEALGLVYIRQGSGIYVKDPQLTGGVELFEVLMTLEDGSINAAFLRDVLEFRGHMSRLVARLAAARRTDEQLAAIKALVEERRSAWGDSERLATVNHRLFHVIAQATHNRIYELVFNTMGRITIRLGALIDIPLLGFEQTQRQLEQIVDAFEHQDAELADLLVARYIRAVEEMLPPKE